MFTKKIEDRIDALEWKTSYHLTWLRSLRGDIKVLNENNSKLECLEGSKKSLFSKIDKLENRVDETNELLNLLLEYLDVNVVDQPTQKIEAKNLYEGKQYSDKK